MRGITSITFAHAGEMVSRRGEPQPVFRQLQQPGEPALERLLTALTDLPHPPVVSRGLFCVR